MISAEALVVIAGWITSLVVAIYLVPKVAARRVCEQFGLSQVHQGGKTFFVPTDPGGDPLKVPIGTKEGKDGEQEIVMGYAPLAYSLPYMVADLAALKVKMSLLSAKGRVTKALNAEAIKAGMTDELAAFLPKKVQAALAIARALGFGPGNGSQEGTVQGQTTYRQGLGTAHFGLQR